MAHHHDHSHGHQHTSNKKSLLLAFILIATYMVVEVIGGFVTNSLALLSDAGHMLSDAAALGLSLIAIILGEKIATQRKTFGYRRFEIIAAALNGVTLIVISAYIFYEAFQRFQQPPEIQSMGMLVISIIGLLVNIVAAFILTRGNKEENLNIRSAYLHVLGDMLGSIGAIVAAVLIYAFGWGWADPLASVIVAVLIMISGIRVTKEATHILMEGTPVGVDHSELKVKIESIEDVVNVHDLHIWSISSELPMLSCHITIRNNADHDQVLNQVQKLIREEYHINHSTIQIESEKVGCPNTQLTCY